MREDIKERMELIKEGKVPEGYKKTKLGIIFENFEIVLLGELMDFQNGINAEKEKFGRGIKIISVSDILHEEPISYYMIKESINITTEQLDKYSVAYGDILFQRSSENIEDAGKANVYLDKKYIATFGGFVIRGRGKIHYNPIVVNEILKMRYVRKQEMKLAAGVQHINIGQDSLKKVRIAMPDNMNQEHIRKYVNYYRIQINLFEKLLNNKQKQREWIAKNLLTGKKRLMGYKKAWNKSNVSDVVMLESKERVKDLKQYKRITIKLNFGGLEINQSDRELADTRPFYLRKEGELIIGKQNYFNGSIALVTKQFDNTICSNAIMSFKICEDKVVPFFLLQYLSQPEYIKKRSHLANGTGQKELSENEFLRFEIMLPNIPEQKAIVKVLETADKEISILEKKLELLKQEKKAIMQLLLTGIVRVSEEKMEVD